MRKKHDTTIDKTTLLYYNKGKQKRNFTCTIKKKTTIDAWLNSTTYVEATERLSI